MLKAHLISGRSLSDPLPDLDDAALDRILHETNHVSVRPSRVALREALLSTLLNYRTFKALDDAPSLSAARRALREAHHASRDLLATIRPIEESGTLFALLGRQVGREHPSGRPPVYDVLRDAIAAVRDLERWLRCAASATTPKHPHFGDGVWRESPSGLSENWLLARSLPRTFSELFNARFTASVTRDGMRGASPGTRFVIASCRELGLGEKTPEAVKQAYRRYRKGKDGDTAR